MSAEWVSEQTNVCLCDWQGPPRKPDTGLSLCAEEELA